MGAEKANASPGVKVFRWDFREERANSAAELSSRLGVCSAVARVLANRGFENSAGQLDTFLNPALSSIGDPFALRDMKAGIERVCMAMDSAERTAIFGDYDSDGATSTSLLVRLFRFLHYPVSYYIPHRMTEGYGLNNAAIDTLAASGVRLIITVDNGITAVDQVEYAKSIGVDIVITDHHQPGAQLPRACAVINPNRPDCTYPGKYLTGVGVAFKFAHALLKRRGVGGAVAIPFLREQLDLVAIGTLADLGPLIGENRVLVKHGLRQIANSRNVGVNCMKRMLKMESGEVSVYKVCFQIAPRLNAAGRTDHAGVCVELLTTDDECRAMEIAQQLDVLNLERRNTERDIFTQCLRLIEEINLDDEQVIVLSGPDWHVGVIGIVASRIVEAHARPVIVLSENAEYAKGSARSVAGFSIFEALQRCEEYLTAFGGHPFAAGLQLSRDKISAFRRAINDCAREMLIGKDISRSLLIDTQLESHEVGQGLIRDLRILEPHGPANPAPVFSMRGLRRVTNPRIVGNNHLKLQLSSNGKSFSAIGFNMGGLAHALHESPSALVDVAFVPTINTFNVVAGPQVELELKDLKIRFGT